jgi:hypothetical protein
MIIQYIVFAIQLLLILVAYMLAPFAAAIRGIYVYTMIYSNKILDDIFPPDLQIYNEQKGGAISNESCNKRLLSGNDKSQNN